jgi:tetratricopeptide (TPR) repeat protein
MNSMNWSPHSSVRRWARSIAPYLGVPLALTLTMAPVAVAEDQPVLSEEQVAERAKGAWESAAINGALDILDQGIHDHPDGLALHKLRGDIFTTIRRPREAVAAYETVLARQPAALDVRWAKWSVLIRAGWGQESIAELQRIAQVDAKNPLVHLRLAQELRNLDRLEESLEPYKRAVALAPDLLGWRLGMARARFDLLDFQGADEEVQYVLQRVPRGSPLELPAKNLQSLLTGSMAQSRRFESIPPADVTPAQRKEWALIRADAWRLAGAGRYAEAEPIFRRLLALNPGDPTATHQLGAILMQLGRCEEALTVLGRMFNLDPNEEDYADTVFRMGQCLVELEQWEEAFVHFQTLYDAAVEFEKASKDVALPPGTRVLDKQKLARWLEKVRPHVPDMEKPKDGGAAKSVPPDPPGPPVMSEEERYRQAVERLKPQKALDGRTSLMGRDADFSLFRFVIPASQVMRDDFPTGEHDFIPIHPGDSFATTQKEIYLVFGLVTASYDAVALTAQCVLETSEVAGEQRILSQDRVVLSTSDLSGYFMLTPPKTGWMPGLYRCGLYEGERASAYTLVDEVRFRVLDPKDKKA